MNYIKLNSDNTTTYPYELWKLREDFPNVSFPQPYEIAPLADFGVFPVSDTPKPEFDRRVVKLEEGDPLLMGNVYTQVWTTVPLNAQEQQAAAQQIEQEIVVQTQQRLDDFARTRNYDGILSACTYASSTVLKFRTEGQYCVDARDNTWATLYTLLNEVEAGVRPMPSSYADVEPLLPTLTWPA